MPKLEIDIQYASPAIEKLIGAIASPALIQKWVRSTIGCDGLITLRFVNLAEGKRLNAAFRNKDKATNVLTFPYEFKKNQVLADIIFCLPIIRQEAKEQGKTLKAHLAHLIIHGCLHAQGFGHEIEKEAKKMEGREVALLKSLGFSDPYISL
jgi:probable rRNA maturation factor